MADKYAKIGEYTPVEAMVINAARFLKNFDGQRGLIGTGLPLVATQLAKMLYCPNMIIFVETGQAFAASSGYTFNFKRQIGNFPGRVHDFFQLITTTLFFLVFL
jgi:acyl CoA:acetate/3-ketoacid CoA transferase beta subunit